MAQKLAMSVHEHQDDGDVHLPHAAFDHNTSVSASTGTSAAIEVAHFFRQENNFLRDGTP